MPAAGYAAKAGVPLLWVNGTGSPPRPRRRSRRTRRQDLGRSGPRPVPDSVLTALEKLGLGRARGGHRRRRSAITFARFTDEATGFGWSIVDPGHGLVFASSRATEDAAAAAAVGERHLRPVLLLPDAACSRSPCRTFCSTSSRLRRRPGPRRLQPGGHGDESAIAAAVQARIDRSWRSSPSTPEPAEMAEAEQPERLRGGREATVDDVRQLVASATPHSRTGSATGSGRW